MFKAIRYRVFISRAMYKSIYLHTPKTWSSSKPISTYSNTVMLEFHFLWQMSQDPLFPRLLSPACPQPIPNLSSFQVNSGITEIQN